MLASESTFWVCLGKCAQWLLEIQDSRKRLSEWGAHVSQHRDIHQWRHAAGGVMQTNEGTVTLKCEGCGVRKPEAERYRPQSACTVCSQGC